MDKKVSKPEIRLISKYTKYDNEIIDFHVDNDSDYEHSKTNFQNIKVN